MKFFTPWTNWTWYVSEYDPDERSVNLVATRPLKLNTFHQITIQSTLTDVEGNPLGSPGAGLPGPDDAVGGLEVARAGPMSSRS